MTPSAASGVTRADGEGPTKPRWLDGEMHEPWFRDLVCAVTAAGVNELPDWAERVAHSYSRSGSLEVTAVVWALLDEIDRLRSDGAR